MKKPGLMKKYIKAAKGDFKKAWRLQKAKKVSGLAGKKAVKRKVTKKRAVKKATHTTNKKRTVTVMARRKRRRVSVSRKRRSPRRYGKSVRMTNVTNALINGALVGSGAVASLWAVNLIPMVKTQSSWVKSGIQAAAGIVGLTFVRDLKAKKVFSGAVVGAVVQAAYQFLPSEAKFAGRGLSNAELVELQTMGVPARVGMSDVYNPNAAMGVPVDVSNDEYASAGRGSRSYANIY